MLLLQLLSVSVLAAPGGIRQAPTAQNLPTTITFSEPAAPLSRLMPDLAKATRLPLRFSKAIADEVLLVDVHDVPVDSLLKHIAQAVGGNWSEEKEGYFLGPDVAKRTRLQDLGFQMRVARLDKALKQMSPEAIAAAAAEAKKNAKPDQQDFSAMMARSQGDEFFYHVLSAIGAQQLATLEQGDRAVLSTKPTGRQYALPPIGEWLSAYIARRNTAINTAKAKAAAANGDDSDGGNDTQIDGARFSGFGGRWGNDKTIDKTPAKVLLILERSANGLEMFNGQDMTCSLVLYDDKGNIVGQDQSGLGSAYDPEEMQAMMDEAQHKTPPANSEKPIEMSAESKLLTQYLRTMSGGPGNPATKLNDDAKAKVKDLIAHPEKFDPLAYPSDLITGLAKAKKSQVVACLPDEFCSWLITLFLGSQTPTAIQKKLANDRSVVSDLTDGWITISPATFKYEPVNRVDLQNICSVVGANKNPSIDQLAQLALGGLGDPNRGALPQLWIMLGDMQAMMIMGQDWDMLRLYGTLTPEQRLQMTQTKRLSIQSMTADQRAMLDRMVYGASSRMSMYGGGRLSVETKPDENSVLGPAQSAFQDSMAEYGADGSQPNDYRSEPTEAAPNGLPNGTAITFKLISEQVLQPVLDPNRSTQAMDSWMSQPQGVEQIASMVAMREMPQSAEQSAMMPKFDHVSLGTKRTMIFRIYVSTESFLNSRLTDCAFQPGSSYALNGLPGDLQKKYDSSLKEMREAFRNQGNEGGGDGGGGGGAPPR